MEKELKINEKILKLINNHRKNQNYLNIYYQKNFLRLRNKQIL